MPLDKEKKPLKKNTLETAPKADHKPIAKRKLKSTRNVDSVIKPKKQILTKNVAIAPSATKNEIQAADAEIEELFKNKKNNHYYEAVGRRKTAVARVRLFTKGDHSFTINHQSLEKYFGSNEFAQIINAPLQNELR